MTAIHRIDVAPPQQSAAQLRGADASGGGAAATTNTQNVGETKLQQAAKDFEAVFLRQMLSALERTTKVGDKGPSLAGQQAYGSMIVESVADAVSKAGGIGLASVLSKALIQKAGFAASDSSSAGAKSGASSVQTLRSYAHPESVTDFNGISPQGFTGDAVPRTEIRTSASQMMGQLADRRIR